MSIKNVLIPLDDSDKTFDSIEAVKELKFAKDAKIYILHIVDNYDVQSTDPEDPNTAPLLSRAVLEKGAHLLEGYDVEKVFIVGAKASVVKEILSTVDEKSIDLIVMTKTGRGFFDKYIIGSVTKHIISRANVPIMLIP